MSNKPKHSKAITVKVRDTGTTYMARAVGMGITASCTGHPRVAANRCADKVFPRGWKRETVAPKTYKYSSLIGGQL